MCAGKNCPKNNKNPGEKHRGEKEAALEARYAAWMQVALKAVYLAKDIQWVYELFPRLKEREWQLAGTLSGGEQQMLAVGRARRRKR